MKKYISLIVVMALLLPMHSQTLVEKFRSEPGERWFNRAELSQRSQGSFENYFDPSVDFNGLSYHKNDSLVVLWCLRFTNGADITQDFLVSSSKPDDDDLWGPVNVDGQGNHELVIWRRFASSPLGTLELFTMETGTTSLTAQIDGVVGIFDVDGDGLVDIIQYDDDTRTMVVIGVAPEKEGRRAPVEASRLHSGSAYAPELKYESDAGEALAFLPYAFWSDADWDANGDGIREVVLERTNADDLPIGLRVVNGVDKEERLRIRFDTLERQEGMEFLGFYDIDGQNGKEVYFSNGTVIESNRTVHYLPEHFVPTAFVDVDGDDLIDILGHDTLTNQVQIYGQLATTPVPEMFQQSLGLAVESAFPNPASDQLQLPLNLSEAKRVRVSLYDTSGRLVRSLTDNQFIEGEYLLNWSLAGLAKGVYYLEVRMNKGMLSQKIVLQ